MSKFFSSLLINGKKFPSVHQVLHPRYNAEYFKRLVKNISSIEELANKRCPVDPLLSTEYQNFKQVKDEAQKLVILYRNQMKSIRQVGETGVETKELVDINNQIQELEDRLHPLIITLPNRLSKHVPKEDCILKEVKSDFMSKQNLFKILSHRKLSYINNCYSKSVVGPNSHFYYGIGAQLNYALADYFSSGLEKHRFLPTSGMCLTKSALVEASNHPETKVFDQDPGRILNDDGHLTGLHLVESSKESILSFINSIERSSSNESLRLISTGASYKLGTQWFDSDEKSISQFETAHVMSISPSIEQYSLKEYQSIRDIIWDLYEKLEIPSRLVHCSMGSMYAHEFDTHKLDVWLPSENCWIPVGRVSHYLDFLTVRNGLKRGHITDATVYNSQSLIASIIENNQRSNGRFVIPEVLKSHMLYLTDEEEMNHFQKSDTTPREGPLKSTPVLNNYEQRRYLTKRNYVFGHSRKSETVRKGGLYMSVMKGITCFVLILNVFDWSEIYLMLAPKPLRRLLYDYVARPFKRLWWWYSYTKDEEKPKDLTYDELDHNWDDKELLERRRILWGRSNPQLASRSVNPPEKYHD